MTDENLLVKRYKLESILIDLDIEILYLEEEKYNLQKEIKEIDNLLCDFEEPIFTQLPNGKFKRIR